MPARGVCAKENEKAPPFPAYNCAMQRIRFLRMQACYRCARVLEARHGRTTPSALLPVCDYSTFHKPPTPPHGMTACEGMQSVHNP